MTSIYDVFSKVLPHPSLYPQGTVKYLLKLVLANTITGLQQLTQGTVPAAISGYHADLARTPALLHHGRPDSPLATQISATHDYSQ